MWEPESLIEFGSSLQISKMIKKACETVLCVLSYFLRQEFTGLERPTRNVRGRSCQINDPEVPP